MVTGPRHGFFTGFDKLQNALEIYTAAFDDIAVDADANTMTVGGAVTMQGVVEALYAKGKNVRKLRRILLLCHSLSLSLTSCVAVGSGPCVGFVGATMGGGLGRLQGLYGFISDNLLSARLMLPNTTVVEASADSNPELFWGIRGAGFNFGFVLNATYRVHDAVPNGENFNADYQFPLNATRVLFTALKQEAPRMPAPLCIDTAVLWDTNLNSVCRGDEDHSSSKVLCSEADRTPSHRCTSTRCTLDPRARAAKPSHFSLNLARQSVRTRQWFLGET